MRFAPALHAAFLLATAPVFGEQARGALRFDVPPGTRISFGGALGERLERNVDEWILRAPAANPGMLQMFRQRDREPAPQIVPWAGEFAGKYLLGAVSALRMSNREDLRRFVAAFVQELISTQAEDGYLGPFPKRERLLGNWDLWGHYHVMLGLLNWQEYSGDAAAFTCAVRAADLICATYLDGGRRIFDAGSHEMNMAVIHVMGWLYRLTSNERYFRLIKEIEKDWERSGDYFRQGLAGVDFFRTPRPRWESLHDLQGLVELFRITGDERYRTSFLQLWRSIALRDRHNTGGFSSGEQAVGHPYSPAPIETCCTVAWMAITVDALRLTGDPEMAEELELSTWNGLLGAQHPTGRWWTYSTPMDGVREASAHAIVFQSRAGTPELNCCSVNGPRGLGLLSEWVVQVGPGAVAVNLHGEWKAFTRLAEGVRLGLEETPEGGGAHRITLRPERPARFQLLLRIPRWAGSARLRGPDGGEPREVSPGTLAKLEREWRDGDSLVLELEERLRVVAGDRTAAGKISLYQGPFLLAYDQRWNTFDEAAIPRLDASALDVEPAPGRVERRGPLDPLRLVTLKAPGGSRLVLCDYATAGAAGTRYRSWLDADNIPPAVPILDRPNEGQRLQPGKVRFNWSARRPPPGVAAYDLEIRGGESSAPLLFAGQETRRTVDLSQLKEGELEWRVTARGPGGAAGSSWRRLVLDSAAPSSSPLPADAPGPGPSGELVLAPLRGTPEPAHGLLLDARGNVPAQGPGGDAGGAVRLDGKGGRLRYALPYFPGDNYTVVVSVRVLELPAGRLGQIFSAWAAPSDDPLRLVVENGALFARVETPGGGASTSGVPVETGKWIRIAAVKAGSRLTLHVGGIERGHTSAPAEITSEAVSLGLGGNPNFSGDESLACELADFRLYERAVSLEEAARLTAPR